MKNSYGKVPKNTSIKKIESSLSKTNKSLINKFTEAKKNYVVDIRLRCIKNTLIKFAHLLEKDFNKATKEEITKAGGILIKSNLSIKTKQDDICNIKSAFRFWFGEDEYYPKVVSGLKRPKSRGQLRLPDEMLSEENTYQVIKSCSNSRDKFIVALMGLDGALRPTEICNIKWGNVKKDKYGHFIIIHTAKESGNKETRTVRIIKSEPYFIKWNQDYPAEKRDESFLFINHANFNQLSPGVIHNTFKRLNKKLKFKRLYPYLLRHSVITRMSKDPRIPVSVLKKFVGHSQRSNTISEYQHFGDDDLKDMQLQFNGIKKEKETQKEIKPINCPKCNKKNEYDSEFCSFCNLALTQKRMVDNQKYNSLQEEIQTMKKSQEKLDKELEKRRELDPLLNKLMNHPIITELLQKANDKEFIQHFASAFSPSQHQK